MAVCIGYSKTRVKQIDVDFNHMKQQVNQSNRLACQNNRDRLVTFFDYAPAIRRIIYTTNPIESYHRMVRKVTKSKGAFASENAIVKQIYLATINANTKWQGQMFGCHR